MQYPCTNEDLRGIVSGLDLSPKDSVLAVAGSGDQAFAFLEYAAHVKAVDINPNQIKYMQQKARALRAGDYEEFLRIETADYIGNYGSHLAKFDRDRRKKYFVGDDPLRLAKIRGNLDNLVIAEPADIIEVAQTESGYTKTYLSNVIGYRDAESYIGFTPILRGIARNLPLDGLIYVANHGEFLDRMRNVSTLQDFGDTYVDSKINNPKKLYPQLVLYRDRDLQDNSFLPLELVVDRDLSAKARRGEGLWKPAVYRRVKPNSSLSISELYQMQMYSASSNPISHHQNP